MFFVTIAGHLGKDPETRFTPGGQKVTTFSLAVNHRRGKDKEEVTMWVRVTVWGDDLDKVMSYLKKGSGVIVSGRMSPPTIYTDKEGRTQVSLEVTAEMIEFSPFGRTDRSNNEGQTQTAAYPQAGERSQQHAGAASGFSQSFSRSSETAHGSGSFSSNTDDDAIPF